MTDMQKEYEKLYGEREWRSLLKNAPNFIVIVDHEGKILFINRTLTGIPIEQIIGRYVYDFVPPEDHEKVRASIDKVFTTGEISEHELIGIAADGSTACYLSRIGPIKDNGSVVNATIIATDITDRKRMENDLRKSEEKYKTIFELSPEGIAVLDKVGTIVDINNRIYDFTGHGRDEVIGKRVVDVDFLKPKTKMKVVSKVTQRILGKEVPPYEVDFVNKDGEKSTARIIASTLRDEKGERMGEIIMFSDVTERKKTELELRESERKFKTIVDNMNDVVFQLSPLGRIRYVSPRVKDLYGYEPEELLGKHFKKTTPTNEMPRALEAIKSVAAGKPLKNFELCQVDKSGKEFHMEINATPILRESKVIAVQGVMRDITESKRAMESAAEIQRSLLPVSPPRIRSVDIYWKFIPCKKIGGDLFNVFFLDKDHLAVFMLDVSGQGVCAAMMGVSVSQLLRPQTAYLIKKNKILPPSEVLKSLDSEYPIERFGRHFTISYLVLNIRSGLLKYSNAGHPSPLLVRKDGGFETLEEGGVIIGLGDMTQFEEGKKQLRAGDKLFIFTDGILEYQNKAERFYGRGRLDSTLWKLRERPVSKMLEGVVEDLMRFGDHAHPPDDITILGLEFKGRKSKSAPKR